ncbi:hypothetical protein DVH24_019812 [Malus domestica]|uniref:Uncharacterized protein n=1 Tax=Malus domestica TaxID=3750 RepID=A0A498I409_MALDO|nr:hypothetical protein DVH24_019812 [Malus domestica]
MAKLPSISSWFLVMFSSRCSEMAFLPMLGMGPSSYFFSLQLGFFFPLPFCWLFSLADLCFNSSYIAFCLLKSCVSLKSSVLYFTKYSWNWPLNYYHAFLIFISLAVSVFKVVVHPCECRFVDVLWKLIKLVSKEDFVSLFPFVIPELSSDFRRIFSLAWERPVFKLLSDKFY